MLVIRKIHVTYHLAGTTDDQLAAIERVHGFHADYCPVARTIRNCVEITTEYELV